MKPAFTKILAVCVVFAGLSGLPVSLHAQSKVIPLWPDGAPGSEGWTQKEVQYLNDRKEKMVRNVVAPTLTAFFPGTSTANGTAVIVCPGGGFRFLSWETEGAQVAEWFAARGVAAFVLKYRIMDTGVTEEEFRKALAILFRSLKNHPIRGGVPEEAKEVASLATADGRQAIKVVRRHAADWGIRPDRIGILGFSAGGMVTMGVVMDHDAESRPNFAAPIYGGGTNGARIPEDAPPLFILAADDDPLGASSVQLYSDWKAGGRPAELHIFSKGGHGFGMRRQNLPVDGWIEHLWDWLVTQGFLTTTRGSR